MAASSSSTLLTAAQASLLYKQVTVELTNGLSITGRIVHFDADTMNLKLDSITMTTLLIRNPASGASEARPSPPQLPPMHSIAIRGNTIKWVNIAHDEPSGAAQSVESAVRLVRANGLAEVEA